MNLKISITAKPMLNFLPDQFESLTNSDYPADAADMSNIEFGSKNRNQVSKYQLKQTKWFIVEMKKI